jgi:hypothetical protein
VTRHLFQLGISGGLSVWTGFADDLAFLVRGLCPPLLSQCFHKVNAIERRFRLALQRFAESCFGVDESSLAQLEIAEIVVCQRSVGTEIERGCEFGFGLVKAASLLVSQAEVRSSVETIGRYVPRLLPQCDAVAPDADLSPTQHRCGKK